jgi:hypothetical protein
MLILSFDHARTALDLIERVAGERVKTTFENSLSPRRDGYLDVDEHGARAVDTALRTDIPHGNRIADAIKQWYQDDANGVQPDPDPDPPSFEPNPLPPPGIPYDDIEWDREEITRRPTPTWAVYPNGSAKRLRDDRTFDSSITEGKPLRYIYREHHGPDPQNPPIIGVHGDLGHGEYARVGHRYGMRATHDGNTLSETNAILIGMTPDARIAGWQLEGYDHPIGFAFLYDCGIRVYGKEKGATGGLYPMRECRLVNTPFTRNLNDGSYGGMKWGAIYNGEDSHRRGTCDELYLVDIPRGIDPETGEPTFYWEHCFYLAGHGKIIISRCDMAGGGRTPMQCRPDMDHGMPWGNILIEECIVEDFGLPHNAVNFEGGGGITLWSTPKKAIYRRNRVVNSAFGCLNVASTEKEWKYDIDGNYDPDGYSHNHVIFDSNVCSQHSSSQRSCVSVSGARKVEFYGSWDFSGVKSELVLDHWWSRQHGAKPNGQVVFHNPVPENYRVMTAGSGSTNSIPIPREVLDSWTVR